MDLPSLGALVDHYLRNFGVDGRADLETEAAIAALRGKSAQLYEDGPNAMMDKHFGAPAAVTVPAYTEGMPAYTIPLTTPTARQPNPEMGMGTAMAFEGKPPVVEMQDFVKGQQANGQLRAPQLDQLGIAEIIRSALLSRMTGV